MLEKWQVMPWRAAQLDDALVALGMVLALVRAAQRLAAEGLDADEHLEAAGAASSSTSSSSRSICVSHWTKNGSRSFSSIMPRSSSRTSGYLLKLSEVNMIQRTPAARAAAREASDRRPTGWLRIWRPAILITEQKLQVYGQPRAG